MQQLLPNVARAALGLEVEWACWWRAIGGCCSTVVDRQLAKASESDEHLVAGEKLASGACQLVACLSPCCALFAGPQLPWHSNAMQLRWLALCMLLHACHALVVGSPDRD